MFPKSTKLNVCTFILVPVEICQIAILSTTKNKVIVREVLILELNKILSQVNSQAAKGFHHIH